MATLLTFGYVSKMVFPERVQALWDRAVGEYKRFSPRERNLVLAAFATVVLIGTYLVYEPVAEAFSSQAIAIADAEQSVKRLSLELERYGKFESRRREIENRYKEVEIKEGAFSYLETLLREKAGVNAGFNIKDTPGRAFGGDFEQVTFLVKFSTTDYERLLQFLKELVYGARPLILGKLDVQMNRRQTALDVDLEVSTIRRITRES